MKNSHLRNLSILTLATLFNSSSSVLGRYIAMTPEVIIWFRASIAMVCLFFFCKYTKVDFTIKKTKDYKSLFISGFLMTVHWVTYFYALKLANVALGILSLYTFPIIVTLLEPFFFKVKLNPIYILFGLMVLTGLYILMPGFNIESTQVKGILCGVFSAFCYALRILVMKQQVAKYNGSVLLFYETAVITVLLIPILFFSDLSGLQNQLPYLVLLAILATAVGHSLILRSLKFFSASTTSIIGSLQPIFGIILAVFFLNEIPTWNTFWGGSLILFTVVIEGFRSKN